MDTYKALFGINCGVTCLGGRLPDHEEKTEEISAETSELAYRKAMAKAKEFAKEYFGDPLTNLTTVRLLELSGPKGMVSFDASKAVVRCSDLERVLLWALERGSEESSD